MELTTLTLFGSNFLVWPTGGGCVALGAGSPENYVLITANDGVSLPTASDWMIGSYDGEGGFRYTRGSESREVQMGDGFYSVQPVFAQHIARVFSRILREHLHDDDLSRVIKRNHKERAPDVCHSHDFCDANMLMNEAYCRIMGLSEDDGFDANDPQQAALWNDAWALAKDRDFYVEAALCEELRSYCHAQGLPHCSAGDLIHRDSLTQEQRLYLHLYIARWFLLID